MIRFLSEISQLIKCMFFQGVVGLFRNPRVAASYWRNIASAALQPVEVRYEGGYCLSRRNIKQFIPEGESVPLTIIDYRYDYGNMPVHELMILCSFLRYRQPGVIFEIGTFLGGTTLQLAANSCAEVYTLDLPPSGHKDYVQPQIRNPESDVYPDEPGIRLKGSPYQNRVHQLFGNSQTFDFTPYYGSVDFVFVDGCHHYEYALRDSENALKMVSDHGVIVWHDYSPCELGVVKALHELNHDISLLHIEGTSLVIYHRLKE